ncbi:hypothetical protein EMPS_06593 [Entomortierella parvispora]|uniref:Uncharacterized protein n=1 Tax=Entomortierella parvispora TaxID=205924 RepID=A0A9P3HCK3_9FUNG|nr:hypothetical protein EMPS_06593 [Entomortierella parvispora]
MAVEDALVKTFNALTQGIPKLMLTQVAQSEKRKEAILKNCASNLTKTGFEDCDGLESHKVKTRTVLL